MTYGRPPSGYGTTCARTRKRRAATPRTRRPWPAGRDHRALVHDHDADAALGRQVEVVEGAGWCRRGRGPARAVVLARQIRAIRRLVEDQDRRCLRQRLSRARCRSPPDSVAALRWRRCSTFARLMQSSMISRSHRAFCTRACGAGCGLAVPVRQRCRPGSGSVFRGRIAGLPRGLRRTVTDLQIFPVALLRNPKPYDSRSPQSATHRVRQIVLVGCLQFQSLNTRWAYDRMLCRFWFHPGARRARASHPDDCRPGANQPRNCWT
ncbi:hypothetical protein ATK36_0515 [Amycolatopsis sulphurea]|uniref:Uncharacterized protein n=1 Tax=Amycolatopsis sulphurea TaxID=76022 RepID=A0A2A9FZW9_9PSEU|nr:hypothetical protein ATK36_0515 [Amycolatopsis sulphurea]